MSKDIKNILQEKFEGFEPQPTRNLWAGIEAEIQPRRRIAPVWWYAAAAAVAILLTVALWPGQEQPLQSGPALANQSDSLDASQPEQVPAILPEETVAQALVPQKTRPGKHSLPQNTRQQPAPRSLETPTQEEATPRIHVAAIKLPALSTISLTNAAPEIPPTSTASAPAPEKKNLLYKDIKLSELDPITVVSLASETLDELGVRSPVRYQLEKQEELKQKKSRFELVLGKFSFTHTTHRDM